MTFALVLPWVLLNYVISERVYHEDEIWKRLLLQSTYYAWLYGMLFLLPLLFHCLITFQHYKFGMLEWPDPSSYEEGADTTDY